MKHKRGHKGATDPAEFFSRIRRIAIIAMFSDDALMQKLVLKGGNALDLVHSVGGRVSLDIDLSIDGDDFSDLNDFQDRAFRALSGRFETEGYVLFDPEFSQKPSVTKPGQDPKWGGYVLKFKLIDRGLFKQLIGNIDDIRRNALPISSQHLKTFTIEISRNEYCTPKQAASLDNFTIYVYTLPMIAIEKLRAICQQLHEYQLRKNPTPRARDFYDIHAITSQSDVDLFSKESLDLLNHVFAAKNVPIGLLARIRSAREFHRPDWPAVVNSTRRLDPPNYDFYFDFVVDLAERLHAARVE